MNSPPACAGNVCGNVTAIVSSIRLSWLAKDVIIEKVNFDGGDEACATLQMSPCTSWY
jgi:hypothetical protein